jgi:type I restriction enzyme R subunit
MGTPVEIINHFFGGKEQFDSAIQELERELFRQDASA